MSKTRIWIVDGHNVIFEVEPLRALQRAGRGDEARRGLVDALRRAAHARSRQFLVVFDGSGQPLDPGAIREPLLQAVYARGKGGADERIVREAQLRREQGHPVTVVTNDVSTLARRLPAGVEHLRVAAFWTKHVDRPADPNDKPVAGDFSDMEREMEAQAATAERAPRSYDPAPAPRAGVPRPVSGTTGQGAARNRLRSKREQGRLRQKRRLARRPGRGGRA